MPASDQGSTSDRYTLVPRTLIFITRGERILLSKGAPHKRLWANLYNGIGGHIEPGEEVLSAAQRELLEETGLSVDDLWLCGTIIITTGKNPGIGIFVLRGESESGKPRNSDEGILEWISINQFDQRPLVEDLYTLLPRVLAMRKSDPPFSAHYSYDADDRLVINFNSGSPA